LAGGFKQVKRANCIGIEIVERNGRRAIVRRLGGGVDDGIGLELVEKVNYALTVADVELVMDETWEVTLEAFLVPTGIALWTEEGGALVVIQPMDIPAQGGEMDANFGADEAGGTGDE